MTRTALKTVAAGLAAVMVATAAMTVPAAAGGSITFNYTPKNAKQKQALTTGLAIYGIVNAVQDGSIKQFGKNNVAGLGQNGAGNFGVIHQEGNGHHGTLQQNGNGNSYGVFQFGKNTDADVVQNGNGQTGATFAFGW